MSSDELLIFVAFFLTVNSGVGIVAISILCLMHSLCIESRIRQSAINLFVSGSLLLLVAYYIWRIHSPEGQAFL